MNAADARAYMNRWQLVAEVEREELARKTPAQKFADTAMLMSLAYALGGSTHTDEQVEEVRSRWRQLVERWGG
jgi:hypothetical protein